MVIYYFYLLGKPKLPQPVNTARARPPNYRRPRRAGLRRDVERRQHRCQCDADFLAVDGYIAAHAGYIGAGYIGADVEYIGADGG